MPMARRPAGRLLRGRHAGGRAEPGDAIAPGVVRDGRTPRVRTTGRRRFAAGTRPVRAAHPARARRQGGRPALQPDVQRPHHQCAGTPGAAVRRWVSRSWRCTRSRRWPRARRWRSPAPPTTEGCFFGLTADRDAIPDVEEFAEYIGEAIARAAARRPVPPPVEKPARPVRSGRSDPPLPRRSGPQRAPDRTSAGRSSR